MSLSRTKTPDLPSGKEKAYYQVKLRRTNAIAPIPQPISARAATMATHAPTTPPLSGSIPVEALEVALAEELAEGLAMELGAELALAVALAEALPPALSSTRSVCSAGGVSRYTSLRS